MNAPDLLSIALNNVHLSQSPTSSNTAQEPMASTDLQIAQSSAKSNNIQARTTNPIQGHALAAVTAPVSPGPLQNFLLYPNLPFELRLKILTHALPVQSVPLLRVSVQVLSSNPSTGLVLSFRISTVIPKPPGAGLPLSVPHGVIASALKKRRMVALLLVCQETRAVYMEKYGIVLPSGSDGKKQIRISRLETLFIENFSSLIHSRRFRTAISTSPRYPLQDFWKKLERVATPLIELTYHCIDSWAVQLQIIRSLPRLKVLKGALWEGLDDESVAGFLEVFKNYFEGFGKKLAEDLGGLDDVQAGKDGYTALRLEIMEIRSVRARPRGPINTTYPSHSGREVLVKLN